MKRGSPLKRYARLLTRGKPMKRSRIKWKPARRIDRETPAEKEHKRGILEMRVCAFSRYSGAGRCQGPLQSGHLGHSGGMGAKHGDWTTATRMCMSHHDQWDGRHKPSVFDAMPVEAVEELREREIHLAREFVAGRQAVSA